jgi:hypothetical protein
MLTDMSTIWFQNLLCASIRGFPKLFNQGDLSLNTPAAAVGKKRRWQICSFLRNYKFVTFFFVKKYSSFEN